MPSDPSKVDEALFNRLNGDSTLTAAMTGGVHFDVGPKSGTAYVIVSQLAHEDEYMAEGSAWEHFVYLVKAVVQSASGATASTAAQRIHTLLQGQSLSITGYTLMQRMDRLERVKYTEVDEVNADIRWQHRGGHYEVFVSPD